MFNLSISFIFRMTVKMAKSDLVKIMQSTNFKLKFDKLGTRNEWHEFEWKLIWACAKACDKPMANLIKIYIFSKNS